MKQICQMKILAQILLLIVLFEYTSTTVFGCDQDLNKPHIMLHVDINMTLIAEDKSKGLSSDKCLSALFSTDPEYAHTWGADQEKITYKKWVDEKLFPGSYQDQALRKKRESSHTEFLEAARSNNHPMLNEITHAFQSLMDELETQGSRKVFQSFSNLIAYLKKENYPFSVILRTFGGDLDLVSQELDQDGLTFIHGSFCEGVLHLNGRALSTPEEMIAAFEPRKHYAIKDSYAWWKQHNQTETGGKPFPIDITDKRILSIFFDDNANNAKRQILNVMSFGEKTNLSELIKMGRVVAVDTRKAILDRNYFISAVDTVLEKW